MIYIASPYSDPSAKVRQDRFDAVCKYAGSLMLRGKVVFSPIAHSHPIAEHLPQDKNTWEFWEPFDLMMLDMADDLYVLCINGWNKSPGVAAEIKYAIDKMMPVVYAFPEAE